MEVPAEAAGKLTEDRGDAIYSVSIRRQNRALGARSVDQSLVYESTLEWYISAATVPALVDCLGQDDPALLDTFLWTYRAFSSPSEVLSILVEVHKLAKQVCAHPRCFTQSPPEQTHMNSVTRYLWNTSKCCDGCPV